MLGADTFIKRNGGLSVEVDVDGEDRRSTFKLQKLMAKPPCAIITRGTVCYETSEGSVAKFAWAPVKRRPEVKHLKQARSRGVEGMAKLCICIKAVAVCEVRLSLPRHSIHHSRSTNLPYTRFLSRVSSGVAEPDPKSSGKEPWENRIFSCHIISPVGQVIKDFKTVQKLLESLRDAIRAHRFLYAEGGIFAP
ncbi:hypothetical protein E4U52_001360 [Claviceps spartinae]|nr:hypothetical protein E4U52_001360 [Claviceps spartinae]